MRRWVRRKPPTSGDEVMRSSSTSPTSTTSSPVALTSSPSTVGAERCFTSRTGRGSPTSRRSPGRTTRNAHTSHPTSRDASVSTAASAHRRTWSRRSGPPRCSMPSGCGRHRSPRCALTRATPSRPGGRRRAPRGSDEHLHPVRPAARPTTEPATVGRAGRGRSRGAQVWRLRGRSWSSGSVRIRRWSLQPGPRRGSGARDRLPRRSSRAAG
jgi:hypothetical protein